MVVTRAGSMTSGLHAIPGGSLSANLAAVTDTSSLLSDLKEIVAMAYAACVIDRSIVIVMGIVVLSSCSTASDVTLSPVPNPSAATPGTDAGDASCHAHAFDADGPGETQPNRRTRR